MRLKKKKNNVIQWDCEEECGSYIYEIRARVRKQLPLDFSGNWGRSCFFKLCFIPNTNNGFHILGGLETKAHTHLERVSLPPLIKIPVLLTWFGFIRVLYYPFTDSEIRGSVCHKVNLGKSGG